MLVQTRLEGTGVFLSDKRCWNCAFRAIVGAWGGFLFRAADPRRAFIDAIVAMDMHAAES